ncbi:hypothetical protein LCGC14_2869340 [marine sediment metagenome]|uniref:DUF4326 domain-containing protein n=1 Tax=marine sediment metagenome TaxID=412755 RepID=A0A0F8Y3C2_9ZZZZ
MHDKTTVVHNKKTPYEIYIGRPSKWGNPFKVGIHGKRGECIELYRDWIHQPKQKELFDAAQKELKGKVLGCWCSPNPCHGDVLKEIVDSL